MSPDKIIKRIEQLQRLVEEGTEGGEPIVIEMVFEQNEIKFLKKNYPFFYDWTQRLAETLDALSDAENEVGFALETLSTVAAGMKLADTQERGFDAPEEYDPEDDDGGDVIEPEILRANDD